MKSVIHFEAPVAEFAKEIGIKLSSATRLIGLDLMTRIVKRTPVATGRARSGWDLTVGSPSDFMPPETDVGGEKATPGQTFTSAFSGGQVGFAAGAAGIDGIQQVFIVNNLPYIEALENGHSQQSPLGMVQISMDEVASEIELLLEGLKEK